MATVASSKTTKDLIAQKQNGISKNPATSFQDMLSKQLTTQFKAIQSLVPSHVTPERLCRVGLNAVSRNPKLMECDQATIIGAIVNCASLGLEPNLLGHAYIVPFWNSSTRRYEAQFQLGYKGLIELVRRSGEVAVITAREVYEGDEFDYSYGLNEMLLHKPCGEDNEDKITHFYAMYKLRTGEQGFVVMTRKQVEKHRDKHTKSKKKDTGEVFGPWKEHFVAMGLKTCITKMAKYMPVSIEQQEARQMMEAIQVDNTVLEVKDNTDGLGFGESFINPKYVINEEFEEVSTAGA